MVELIIQLIIVLIIAGFVLYVWNRLKAIVAQWIAEPFMSLIDALVWILIGAIIIFWFIIPLIRSLGHLGSGLLR